MIRSTIQRSLILETVRKMQGHVTADEVYDIIAKAHPGISRGTVYRNLNLLADIGEIRKVLIADGADRYDHLCHLHYHARCKVCGKIFDVDMEYISDLEKSIKNAHGFIYQGHDLIFKGICFDCL